MRKRLYAAAFAALTVCFALPTQAQKKKSKLQKRENYEFSFELPKYVEELKNELTYPLAWGNCNVGDFDVWRAMARQQVLECMMAPPQRAEKFDMEVVGEERREGYTARRIRFNINAYSRITAYMLVPDGKGPFPAINLLHDHGGHLFIGKEKMVRPFGVDSAVVNDAMAWAGKLYEGQFVGDYFARNGFVVFTADAPMWGERGREEGVDRSKYDIIAGNMMMLGRNLCAFMTYDDIAATEFMATLPEVDGSNIGCFGCSMGAYRSWMLAALCDKIKAGGAVCWMTTTDVQMSTKDNKRENGGFANCLPGLRQYLDYPHIASMACPKPMMFINGSRDHLFPVDGTKEAFAIMRDTWQSQGAADNLVTELWDANHSCGKRMQAAALEFFTKHMKKPQQAPKSGRQAN